MTTYLPKTKEEEAKEILDALMNYTYDQIMSRMLATGESFDVALANYIEEIQNDKVQDPSIR